MCARRPESRFDIICFSSARDKNSGADSSDVCLSANTAMGSLCAVYTYNVLLNERVPPVILRHQPIGSLHQGQAQLSSISLNCFLIKPRAQAPRFVLPRYNYAILHLIAIASIVSEAQLQIIASSVPRVCISLRFPVVERGRRAHSRSQVNKQKYV